MVDVALPVSDVVDSGGGVYPQPPEQERKLVLLHLRSGAQRCAHSHLQ